MLIDTYQMQFRATIATRWQKAFGAPPETSITLSGVHQQLALYKPAVLLLFIKLVTCLFKTLAKVCGSKSDVTNLYLHPWTSCGQDH